MNVIEFLQNLIAETGKTFWVILDYQEYNDEGIFTVDDYHTEGYSNNGFEYNTVWENISIDKCDVLQHFQNEIIDNAIYGIHYCRIRYFDDVREPLEC